MLKTILKRLNGHAVEAPSLSHELAELGRARAVTDAEIVELNAKRKQALLDDASDTELDRIERLIDRANVRLEKIALAEPPLRERLAAASAAERAAAFAAARARRMALFTDQMLPALAQLRAAQVAAVADFDAARRALGETLAERIPRIHFNSIPLPDQIDSWIKNTEVALSPTPRPSAPPIQGAIQWYNGRQPGEGPLEGAGPGRARPRVTPAAPAATAPAVWHAPRLADDEAPLEPGEVRALVIRNGYQANDGPCHAGRRIRLARAVAIAAARAGVIEIIEDPDRAALERASDKTFRPINQALDHPVPMGRQP